MTLEQYKNRYVSAYTKQLEQLNLLEQMYTDEQLEEAYRLYTNWSLWYHRAFKPGALAQSNVLYTDYQIHAAVDWEWRCNSMGLAEAFYEGGNSKDDLLKYLRGSDEDLKNLMHCYYEEERRNGKLDKKTHRGRQEAC